MHRMLSRSGLKIARQSSSLSCSTIPGLSSMSRRFFAEESFGFEELVPYYEELTIPKHRVDEDEVLRLLDEVMEPILSVKSENYLGYQTNHELPPIAPLTPFLEMHLNNAGDPFIKSSLKTNTKSVERAVLRYCAELWYDAKRNEENPNDPENFWGYVLNMGSTEGNLNALWNAREYMVPKDGTPRPYGEEIVLLSNDAHYSLDKAAGILKLQTQKVETDKYSRVIVEKLLGAARENASQGRPIIAVLNMGTTFAGAYDSHLCVDDLHAIAQEYSVPCWVHMDGALGGFIAAHIEQAVKRGRLVIEPGSLEATQPVPHMGFDLNIQSCNASFYKWVGAPYPCGIFMTQNKYLRQADTPDYIGSPDTTLGGGRNAFAGLYMWYSLCLTDYQDEQRAVVDSLEKAQYLKAQMDALDTELGSPRLQARRAPYSFSVTFNAPSQELLTVYSIPNEHSDEFGGDRSHIYTMKHVTYDVINDFLENLRKDLKQK